MSRVYLIAGASASGKSTVAQQLSAHDSLPVLEMDRLHNLLTGFIPDVSQQRDATRAVCQEIVRQMIPASSDCIVEGGWVNPAQARELFGSVAELSVAFCGFNDNGLDERLRRIREKNEHWLCSRNDDEAMTWLKEQAVASESHYRQQCEQHSLPYFDFSIWEQGASELSKHFRRWRSNAPRSSTSIR